MILPELTPQSAIFGFLESNHKNEVLINHLLLIFKMYMYHARDSNSVSIDILKAKIIEIKGIEENISKGYTQRYKQFYKKWNIVKEIFL